MSKRREGYWWIRHEGREDVVRVGRARTGRPTCDVGPRVMFTDKFDQRGNALTLWPSDPSIEWLAYVGDAPRCAGAEWGASLAAAGIPATTETLAAYNEGRADEGAERDRDDGLVAWTRSWSVLAIPGGPAVLRLGAHKVEVGHEASPAGMMALVEALIGAIRRSLEGAA